MIKLITPFASLFNKDRLEEIKEASYAPYDAQNEQLFNLIAEAEDTVWGRQYDFQSIHSYQDFRERLPIQQYGDIQPYVQRMLVGEENLLWPGVCKYFIPVSDTTSKEHLLPVGRQMLDENFYQGIMDSMAIYLSLKKDESRIFDGYSLWIGADRDDLVYRNLSTMMLKELPFFLKLYARPQEPVVGHHTEKELELLFNEAQRNGICSIQGRPRRYNDFLKYAEDKTGKKGIKQIFPEMEVFFHRGMPEWEQLQHAPIKDIDYHASYCTPEGFFALQDTLGDPEMLLRLDASIFYEFIPMDKAIDAVNVIPLENVQINRDYRMVISTCSGLWRYCSEGPIIRFVSNRPYKIILV